LRGVGYSKLEQPSYAGVSPHASGFAVKTPSGQNKMFNNQCSTLNIQ